MEKPFRAYQGNEPYVFVCYAHDDSEVVYAEIIRLRHQGFNIWYDEGITPGATWRDEVAEALSHCTLFLYFITPQAVASANCQKEVNYALSRSHRILTVHLQETTLPSGLELGLSDVQAILKEDHTKDDYETKLTEALRSLLSDTPLPKSRGADAPQIRRTVEPELTAIAVLPLANRSSDSENEYLCDGISEALINGLSEVKPLKVASQLSAFTFKNKTVDIRTVGAALSVGTVLSGSVQKSGGRLRISVLLDRVKDGVTLWSHHYDEDLADIFDLQDDVARKVVGALKVELDPNHSGQLIDVGTTSPEAYHAYLLGNYEFHKWTHSGFERARDLYRQATHHDESHANAYGRLGLCYMMLVKVFDVELGEVMDAAKEAFHRARSLGFDPVNEKFGHGHGTNWREVDDFLNHREGDLVDRPNARGQLTQAIALISDPTNPRCEGDQDRGYVDLRWPLISLPLLHANLEFLQLLRGRGRQVDYELGDALSLLGRQEEAISYLTSALERDSNHHFARHYRALAYVRTGQLSKAAEDLAVLDRVWPKSFDRFLHPYWLGDLDQARGYFLRNFADHPRFELRLKVVAWIMLEEFGKALDILESEPTSSTGAVPNNLRIYAPQRLIDRVEREPRYQRWLTQAGLDDEMRQEAVALLNQISHATGVTVKVDGEH